MSIQQIVDPDKVESELIRIWEGLAKEKMRACLFNLIVFNRISARTDYFRDVVQKVSEKYPCRVLFISFDPDSQHPYLRTAVSVVGTGNIACDYIDIGVSGPDLQRVPFLLWPHIIPDLPVTLLWTEDPSKPHPLFEPLSKLASRVIFDSESADSLLTFSQKVLALHEETGVDTADLNWARTEGWRDLIASLFHSGDIPIQEIKITYNARETPFFCHLKVQSLYLLAWLSSRLRWKFKKATKNLHFTFEAQKGEIHSAQWEKLGAGTIISIDLATAEQKYECARIPIQYHRVIIQIHSDEKCELPYQYILGRTATGQSLVKEIITKGTSAHYLEMLKNLSQLDRDHLC
ncbi:MAG TPA: glucose-6-phosphate dehydrogenase assembly protein OpcA [Chlamydiales bacterium]|nr:glucose-6-phosphate dehydrogenase assembly protein OpcA [Chlamydiales bacterium]